MDYVFQKEVEMPKTLFNQLSCFKSTFLAVPQFFLFGINRNQAEPAGMKNFLNFAPHSRGNFKT